MFNKGIISYSLWGTNKKYYYPLLKVIKNIFYIESIFKVDFQIVIFHNGDINKDFLNENFLQLKKIKFINILSIPKKYQIKQKRLWRYLAFFEEITEIKNVEYILIRDTDSIIGFKEIQLLKEWYESEYYFSLIRGHIFHTYPIMAGLFASKKQGFLKIKNCLLKKINYLNNHNYYNYTADQKFLSDNLYISIRDNSLVHSCSLVFKKENAKKIMLDDCDFPGKVMESKNYLSNLSLYQSYVYKNLAKDDNFIILSFNLSKLTRYNLNILFIYLYFRLILKNLIYKKFKFN